MHISYRERVCGGQARGGIWRQKQFFLLQILKRDSDRATILGFAAAHYDFGRNDLQPVAQKALCPEVTQALELA
jgi:hypothetical protein